VYVILENRAHLVNRSPGLDTNIQRFKSYTAKGLMALLETAKRMAGLVKLVLRGGG
jgi:putative transposase